MSKNILRLLLGLGLVLALAFSGTAWGSPWAQTFRWYPPPAHIDKLESFIVSGNTDFEAPGLEDFSNGWNNGTRENPDYTFAQGAAASSAFTFKAIYTANPDVPFFQDFIGWYDGRISEAWRFHWQGSGQGGWQLITGEDILTQVTNNQITYGRAPLPPAVLLLGSGLLGLGLLRGTLLRS